MTVLETIYTAGFSAYLHGLGAIDSWLGNETETFVHILTNAGTADIARLFEDLRYPGIDLADAALDDHGDKNETWYFRCADSFNENRPSFNLLEFYQDCKSRVFYDPSGIYPLLAGIRDSIRKPEKNNLDVVSPPEIFRQGINLSFDRTRSSMDAALILAKYFSPDLGAEKYIDEISKLFINLRESSPVKQEEQRILLCSLLTAADPGLGFELLKKSGFIAEYWPELAILDKADHSKEFHPEGNAWEHTMETFRHRKTAFYKKASFHRKAHNRRACDLRLSLGLLLHDAGKPIAVSDGRRRYDGHAELGEIQARRFLERLGFDAPTIRDVCFLVRNHMLPAALPRLPLYRTEEIMASPLFPLLLELYRCDEASSFKGLDGYYESSAAYQSFLRNRRNPYRSADGKKLNNRQISGTAKFYSQR
jgi:poly(A) polymerase